MKIKMKPQEPIRQSVERVVHFSTYQGVPLRDIGSEINSLKSRGVDINLAFLYHESGYDGDCSLYIKYHEMESDEEFGKRVSKYNEEMDKYNLWCEKNKEKIELEIRRREIKRAAAGEQAKEQERIRKEREIRILEQQLKVLKNSLIKS